MYYIIYFIMAIVATTVGSLTGMGGGVIMKPVMDMLGHFDVASIGVLSSITVFSMSLVSIGKQVAARSPVPYRQALYLALGSVVGGISGERILGLILSSVNERRHVTVIQNIILALLIAAVFYFMKNKQRIHCHRLSSPLASILAGIFLGICSSFLGIGGGPINVALIIFLFSVDTKVATVCSLITILFAQVAKLGLIALGSGFGGYDLRVVPAMIVASILGGFIGAALNRRWSEQRVEDAFNAVQVLVLIIAISNIARNL